jgi:hypothetical protein
MSLVFRLLADLVVLLHLGFVVFVVLGGFAVLRWPSLRWAHVPAALWGIWIELSGRICPLTPLENMLRVRAGQPAYTGDFVGRYLLPVLYPAGLTRRVQLVLAAVVVGVNLGVYWWAWISRGSLTPARRPL